MFAAVRAPLIPGRAAPGTGAVAAFAAVCWPLPSRDSRAERVAPALAGSPAPRGEAAALVADETALCPAVDPVAAVPAVDPVAAVPAVGWAVAVCAVLVPLDVLPGLTVDGVAGAEGAAVLLADAAVWAAWVAAVAAGC
ncbi:MAG: hypothetical protein WB611_08330 [Stellaceae bacterium]